MAGRPEKKIDPEAPYGEFATALRGLRESAGLTVRDLAHITGLSPSTLSAAANGRDRPTWDVVSAFVTGCGAKPADWGMRWRTMVVGEIPDDSPNDTPVQMSRHGRPPLPVTAQNAEDFADFLVQLRIWAGDESLRVIETKTKAVLDAKKKEGVQGNFFIARNTLHKALNNRDRLSAREFVEAFLTYCKVGAQDRSVWIQTWQRLRHQEVRAQQDALKRTKMRLAPEPKSGERGA